MLNNYHEPVLLKEVLMSLLPSGHNINNRGRYIDCTLGAGGYTKAICEAGGSVLGIDADESMLDIARENLKGKNVKIVNGNFRDIKKISEENGFTNVDGIVFDLGVSNVHFSDETRGFSFKNPEADLDMRLNTRESEIRASDLLNVLRFDQLKQMFGGSLAGKIVEFRKTKRFQTVGDLLSLFENSLLRGPRKGVASRSFSGKAHIHPATKAFLALRVAVNSELDNLSEALPLAYELLGQDGVLAVVSFNSDEDRIVKDFVISKGGGKEIIRPGAVEINRNPKSRSAILRVIRKNI